MDDFKQFVMDQWGADLKGKKFLMTGEYKYWLVSEEVAKKKIIGEAFSGTYTENGCFEDEPTYLIRTAKELREKARANSR